MPSMVHFTSASLVTALRSKSNRPRSLFTRRRGTVEPRLCHKMIARDHSHRFPLLVFSRLFLDSNLASLRGPLTSILRVWIRLVAPHFGQVGSPCQRQSSMKALASRSAGKRLINSKVETVTPSFIVVVYTLVVRASSRYIPMFSLAAHFVTPCASSSRSIFTLRPA